MTSCLTWVRSPLCSDRKDLEFEELPSREQIKCAKIWVEQYWKHLIAEYFKKCKSCMPSHINASQADSKQDSRVSNQEPSLWRIHLWPALTRLPTPLNPVPQSNFPNGSLCVHRKQVIPTTPYWCLQFPYAQKVQILSSTTTKKPVWRTFTTQRVCS
jgi:hypothetical protein